MQLKQKEKKKKVVPHISVYFIVAQNYCGHMDPLTYIGILDFNGQLQERDKDKVLL